jgi:high-affinity Fe2+/Pb2+ permease
MWLLMLEAGAALLVLVLIVWWTMFSGRGHEPLPRAEERGNENDTPRS